MAAFSFGNTTMATTRMCCNCSHWEPGEYWSATGAEGHCRVKLNMRKMNYNLACGLFEKRKMQGFIYQGGGGNTIEEDMNNLAEKFKELVEDN